MLGVALGAERVEIFTDVEGVMTTDPRLVPGARLLHRLSYRSGHELARFGAKMVHPRALLAGCRARVPLVVRSTFSNAPGTTIAEVEDESSVAGVAHLPAMLTAPLGPLRVEPATRESWERRSLVLTLTDAASGRLLVGAPPDKAGELSTILAAVEPSLSGTLVERAWVSAIGDPAALDDGHAGSLAALADAGCPPVAVERLGCRTTFVVDQNLAARAVAALHRRHFSG